ncbi:MAG: GIY-YIG nuclease family protein, partial [Firmicutes bacterium]|nr:GIY-YIG nuclease family protein [Bacillota bacterium]
MNDAIAQKLKKLPESPGVYIMYGADGKIIYIGKAVVLKNRVKSYFQSGKKTGKTELLVADIADFSYIVCTAELDALALEANLIKKHKPFYNILLKDDRHHPYLRLDMSKEYPSLEVTRRVKRDGAKYFGPYFAGVRVDDVLEIVRHAFRIRTCQTERFKANHKPCLNFHIGQCAGPCSGKVNKSEYAEEIKRAAAFLSGRDEGAREILTGLMDNAAALELFEAAINYRDKLKILDRIGARVL